MVPWPSVTAMTAVPWEQAWHRALYGPGGFYRRPEGPRGHFRTSSHNPLFASAIARLAQDLDLALAEPEGFAVIDVGAGGGELLAMLSELTPSRWRLIGIDVTDRPSHLPNTVDWQPETPTEVVGLLMAHELLDVVPCPVITRNSAGELRAVTIDPESGEEFAQTTPSPTDVAWLDRWWDLDAGERAEVGRPRDALWADLVARVRAGAALAVDYAHTTDERSAGRYPNGTLIGHQRGRVVVPVPDGSCDLTAHVALDACAAATSDLADVTFLTHQREALLALGISEGESTLARELLDPAGLGGFGWLLQTRGGLPHSKHPRTGHPL